MYVSRKFDIKEVLETTGSGSKNTVYTTILIYGGNMMTTFLIFVCDIMKVRFRVVVAEYTIVGIIYKVIRI